MAFDQLAADSHVPGGTPMTPEQVKQYIAEHPDAELYGMNFGPATGIPLGPLAQARNPAEILQALQNAANGSADSALYALGAFNVTTAEAQHPGTHDIAPFLSPLADQNVCGGSH
jgi:hypothetical protein